MPSKKPQTKQGAEWKEIRGRTNWEKLNAVNEVQKLVTDRDKKISIGDYTRIILHWLKINPKCVNLIDFWEDTANQPTLYEYNDILEKKDKRIIKILEARLIKAALNKEINATFVTTLLQNEDYFSWRKDDSKTNVEVNVPIKFEFDN